MRRLSCPALAPVCNVFYLCVVEYKFLAPVEKKSGAGVRRGKERYRWTMKALGPCSQSCGGGQQTQVAECWSVVGQRTVADTKCARGSRPSVRTVSCGRRPCPPAWQPGAWGACSASCGPGLQTRGPSVCRQQLSHSVSIPVSPSLCPPASTSQPGLTERRCEVAPCEQGSQGREVMATQPAGQPAGGEDRVEPEKFSTDWVVQPWGACSVTCGAGVRERKVHCAAQDSRGGLLPDSQCSHLTRPASEQYCDQPCLSDVWLVGQWGPCSAACGQGKASRKVTCLGHCDQQARPEDQQDCEAAAECGEEEAEWLTGRWSVCSHHCGPGRQTRTVHCVLTQPDSGTSRLGRAEDCGKKRKPRAERRCHLQQCGPQYFTSQWSSCSEQCGREGFRTRTVVCLRKEKPSHLCRAREAPGSTETCRDNSCPPSQDYHEEDKEEDEEDYEEDEDYNEIDDLPHTETDTKALKTSEYKGRKSEMSNEILQLPEKHLKFREKSSVCRDKFKNCNVVVQSRLCRYSFYQSNCCSSCAKLHDQ